jgi:NAD+ diphosphatase
MNKRRLPVPWFIFHERKLFSRVEGDTVEIPAFPPDYDPCGELGFGFAFINPVSSSNGKTIIGAIAGTGSTAAERSDEDRNAGPDSSRFQFYEVRSILALMGREQLGDYARSRQLTEWNHTMRLCPSCGGPLSDLEDENAKGCPHCDLHFYPPVSPAVITAIIRDGAILLAHNERFPKGLYSLVAGFVEPGEDLEGCVKREVFEEVGVRVTNIRYFGSQPWPFPHSLMVGFTAEYDSGEIRVDGREIDDARWFTPDTIPNIPRKGSISREIIDWYVDTYR